MYEIIVIFGVNKGISLFFTILARDEIQPLCYLYIDTDNKQTNVSDLGVELGYLQLVHVKSNADFCYLLIHVCM